MPTYDYTCLKCGHEFEVVQPISAGALLTCPKDRCKLARWGKGQVKRGLGGGSGLLFKGSGFYITDYRSESYKSGAKKESEASAPKTTPQESKPTNSTKSGGSSDSRGHGSSSSSSSSSSKGGAANKS